MNRDILAASGFPQTRSLRGIPSSPLMCFALLLLDADYTGYFDVLLSLPCIGLTLVLAFLTWSNYTKKSLIAMALVAFFSVLNLVGRGLVTQTGHGEANWVILATATLFFANFLILVFRKRPGEQV
jgi:hypothetical protein